MDTIKNFPDKEVNQAIEKGIQYLLSLSEKGHWKGFPTLAGQSDIWVTGFILAHIANLTKNTNTIKAAQDFLLSSQFPEGGWSYSQLVPPDADSTAWCLMALQSNHIITSEARDKASSFLWSHFTGSGISTYTNHSGIGEFISASDPQAIIGWTSAHPDVSIAAVLADSQHEMVKEIIKWLLEQPTTRGLINAYWWRSPLYTTTLLLRALSQLNYRLPENRVKQITEALLQAQLPNNGFGIGGSTDLDPFSTALALESFTHLNYFGQHAEMTQCAKALLDSQNKNGSWNGDFLLRIPAPFVIDPGKVESWSSVGGGGNTFIFDTAGVFATTLCCYALDRLRQTVRQPGSAPDKSEWPFQKVSPGENIAE